MNWFDQLASIEAYDRSAFDRSAFDRGLVERLQRAAAACPPRPLVAATPSFQAYATSELSQCCSEAFPVLSVTGGACALGCDHCQAKVLAPMIPALTPEVLDAKVRGMARTRRLGGFLLSGGSNRRNEIAYERFYPVIERLKRDMPDLRIAVHTALLDRARARAMAEAGVDTAMMDVIGSAATIREVYHLDRPVDDFAATLDAHCASGMAVVPHIVIGLHFGRIVGEREALSMCAARPIDALVLVVVVPVHARPGLFLTPDLGEVAELLVEARRLLPDTPLHLGCARPHGVYRRTLDAYAAMAGLDAIAFPSEGCLSLARAIGRPIDQRHRCCAIERGRLPRVEASP